VADADLESAEHARASENHKENPHCPPLQLQSFRYYSEVYRTKFSTRPASIARRSRRRKTNGDFNKNRSGKKNQTPWGYVCPRMKAGAFAVKVKMARPRR